MNIKNKEMKNDVQIIIPDRRLQGSAASDPLSEDIFILNYRPILRRLKASPYIETIYMKVQK